MNVTLSIDDKVVKRARKTAEGMGMTLNQAVREFLDRLAGGRPVDSDLREMEDLSELSEGRSHGWRFNREEIHERP